MPVAVDGTEVTLAKEVWGMKLQGQGRGGSSDGSSFQKFVSEGKPRGEIVLRGNVAEKTEMPLCLVLEGFCPSRWKREGVSGGTQA